MRRLALVGVAAMTAGLAIGRAQQGADSLKSLMDAPAVKAALAAAKAAEPQVLQDQIRFCEIPAPEFKEEVRGRELQRVFQEIGLANVRVDKVGNVLGSYAGRAAHPHLVIAAHLTESSSWAMLSAAMTAMRSVPATLLVALISVIFLST